MIAVKCKWNSLMRFEVFVLSSHTNLKFTSFGNVFNTFKRFILFTIHIETIDFKARNSHLRYSKLHINSGIGTQAGCSRRYRNLKKDIYLQQNVLKSLFSANTYSASNVG